MPTKNQALKLITRLVRHGAAELRDGKIMWASASAQEIRGAPGFLADLSSQGLIEICRGKVSARPEARSWLRRQRSISGEFGDQHRTITHSDRGVRTNVEAQTLRRLAAPSAKEAFLSGHHLAAAERISLWGRRAQLQPRVTMSYDPTYNASHKSGAGAGADITDMAAHARKQLNDLLKEMPKDCGDMLVDVCVYEKGLQTIEQERRWPRRSAKLVLRIALEQAAKMLNLSEVAHGKSRIKPQIWSEPGQRPTRFE